MLRQIVLLVVISVCFVACGKIQGKNEKVILKHPETLEFKDCQVDKWMTQESFEKNEECIKKYQEQGYEIWGER